MADDRPSVDDPPVTGSGSLVRWGETFSPTDGTFAPALRAR
jgi:hypothetical protein